VRKHLPDLVVDFTPEKRMRRLSMIIGVLLVGVGSIWFLQGVGILPGSFMTGQVQWAVNGAVAVGAGLILVAFARRRPA